jgi:hypothetical protein
LTTDEEINTGVLGEESTIVLLPVDSRSGYTSCIYPGERTRAIVREDIT